MTEPLLEVEDLTIQYRTANGPLTAVSDANFSIYEGEYFGLVGESGCGKSTIAKSLLGGLDRNGEVTSGSIRYKGQDIHNLNEKEWNRQIRWSEIALIPQGSMNNLDPLERLDHHAIEIGKTHTDLTKSEILNRFQEMLEIVGLPPERMDDYPHEFSGGMQQRALIALALFLDPPVIIADEPTTALDVIMQDQVFKYLDEIRDNLDSSMLLITHDISVVLESCNRLGVMHAGQLGEVGETKQIFDSPTHPYTILLQRAFPDIRDPNRELAVIEGDPPENIGPVDRCTFEDRCPWAGPECGEMAPQLERVDSTGNSHQAACLRKELVDEADLTEGE